jgi:cysteinyl-tRNA synthetase
MITINGQKMGKSLGNFITLDDFFSGTHEFLEKAYSPMTVRFFILQAHYRSTVDFSNEALQAAEKGFERLIKANTTLNKLKAANESTVNLDELEKNCYAAMNDDLNSPILISHLFDAVRIINSINDGKEKINQADLEKLKSIYTVFVFDVLGLRDDQAETGNNNLSSELIDLILNIRLEAKKNKDFATSDKIRDALTNKGVTIKDTKDGFEWEI